MKKLMAIILTIAIVMSLCVVPASAAGSGVTITITPDQKSVDTATGDVIVTYTVKAKVTDPNLKVGSLTITLDPGAGLTLADEDKDTNPGFYYELNYDLLYSPKLKTGIFANYDYASNETVFTASGTTNARNLNSSHSEVTLMTIMGKIAKGTTGSVTLKTTQHSYGDPSGSTASVGCDVTPATVTILKAPISSVSFTLANPVQGAALPSLSGLGSGYTGAVEWYEGTDATGTTAATGNAKPNTKYTAKITLTASSGESFADSVTIPTGYTKDSSSTSNQLVLTRTFDEPGDLPAASVTTTPAARSDLKYNGSEQVLLGTVGAADGGTMQYSLDNSSWSDAIPKGKDAKTYTVYYMVKGDGDHTDYTPSPNTVSVTIGPKSIADSTVKIDSIPNQVYDGGNELKPLPVVKDGTTPLVKGTDYTVSYTNNTNAGTATLTIKGKENYTGTTTANFTIDPATQTLNVPGSTNVAFNKTRDLKTICSSNAPGATLTFALAPGASMPSGTTFDAATGKVTAGNNTGSFEVTVDSAAVPNYKAALQGRITVYIVTTPAASVTAAPTAKTGLKYNGNDQALVSEGTANGGTMQYSLDNTNWSTAIPKGKNAGNYTVYYMVKGDSDHTDFTPTSNTVSVSIAQKEVTVAPGTYKVSKEYNGTTTAGTGKGDLSVTGIVDSGVSVKATPVAYTSANVGGQSTMDVTINLVGTGNGNYKIKGGATTISVPCEITAKKVTVTGITATNRAYAKDNLEVALTGGTLTGVITGDTVTIDLTNAKGTMTDANAGTGKAVTVTGVALGGTDKNNYKLKEQPTGVTVNITQKTAPTLTDITLNQKYTVTTGEKAIGAVMPDDAGALTYAKGTATQTGSVAIDSWAVDASTGKVTFTLSGGKVNDTVTLPVTITSTNYADTTVNVVITLIKGSTSGGYYYAPTAAVVPDMPMLYRGCTGDAVKTLQDKLNALGYNSGNVDGIFGAKTYAAVTAFQKANSLGVDGIVGKLTWGKIYGVSPAMPVETTTVVGRPTVSYGSRGDAVRKLQELLNALGYDCGSVDGIFGSKTKAAVLAFQKANGLGVDGIVGPLTWGKLV